MSGTSNWLYFRICWQNAFRPYFLQQGYVGYTMVAGVDWFRGYTATAPPTSMAFCEKVNNLINYS